MKKSENRKTCDITFTNKEAKEILRDLDFYTRFTDSTKKLKKHLEELARVDLEFNDNYEHGGYEFWAKEDIMNKEIIEFLQSKIKRCGEFMYHLRNKSGKNNDLVQVVLLEDFKEKSIKIYMNGELVIEEEEEY